MTVSSQPDALSGATVGALSGATVSAPGSAPWSATGGAPWVAPWIVDAWQEALAKLAVDLPTLSDDLTVQATTLAVASLVLLAMLWPAVAQLPLRARAIARTLAAIPLLAPLAIFAAITMVELDAIGERPGMSDIAAVEPAQSPPVEPVQGADPVQPARAAPAERTETTDQGQPIHRAAEPAAIVADPSPQTPAAGAADALAYLAAKPPPAPLKVLPEPTPDADKDLKAATEPPKDARLSKVEAEPPATAVGPVGQRLPKVTTVLYATDRIAVPGGYGVLGGGGLQVGRVTLGRPAATGPLQGPIAVLAEQDFATVATRQLMVSSRFPEAALVFVHGYDTAFDDAVRQGARFAADIGFDGAVIIYSWPSAGDARAYRGDAVSAEAAAPHLAGTLALLAGSTSAKAIHIAAAGLGARTAMGAIRRLKDAGRVGAATKLGEVLLIAPDMDRARLVEDAIEVRDTVAGITLYASASDPALNVTRRHAGATPRAGDVAERGPMVLPSVVTVDVTPKAGQGWVDIDRGTELAAARRSEASGTGPDLGQALSGQALSGQAVPGQAVPGQAVPGQAVPGQALSGQALSGQEGPMIRHARAVLLGNPSDGTATAGLRRVETKAGEYWAQQ